MEFLKRYKIAILLTILVIALFLVYQFFFNDGAVPGLSASRPVEENTIAGLDIIQQLQELEQLDLQKGALFDDGIINSFIDHEKQIQQEPAGRNNPFSRAGTDGVFFGTPEDTSFVQEQD